MQRRGEGSGMGWEEVVQGAVRFMFDIDAGLTLGFELEMGFEAQPDYEKRAMVSCKSIGNLLF